MSMQDYEDAKELVRELLVKNRGISTFVGPKTLRLIKLAEERLSLRFPKTYFRFLLEYGAGGVGAFEFYGVVKEEFEQSGYPDVVWVTLRERREWDLPGFLLPVYELGDGELFCLDFRKKEGDEVKVVGFTPGYSTPEQNLDIVAEDFGELFLHQAQLALKIIRE